MWTGSIWLTVAESDSSEIVTEELLAAASTDTVRSRSLTGKPARLLRAAWTDAWEAPESPGTLPMPLQFILNSNAMRRISRSNARALVGMPVGQIVGRMNEVRTTKDLIFEIVEEYIETTERMHEVMGSIGT